MSRNLVRILVLLAMLLFSFSPAFANSQGVSSNTVYGVTLNTPLTYHSCTATSDVVTITNTNSFPVRVVGQLIVEYVTEAGRVSVPGGFYPVDVTLDPGASEQVTVLYPPADQWPAYSATNDIRELHVDVQLEIVHNGYFVGSIGYGQDWDIFFYPGDCEVPPPPPPGFEGCTPGYYKNHVNATAWSGIDPNTRVSDVFSGQYLDSTLADKTLLEALSFKGGSELQGAQQILLRAAVAAYLNAANAEVDYPLTPSMVVDQVNSALNSSDRGYVIETASQLDSFNNLGCPL